MISWFKLWRNSITITCRKSRSRVPNCLVIERPEVYLIEVVNTGREPFLLLDLWLIVPDEATSIINDKSIANHREEGCVKIAPNGGTYVCEVVPSELNAQIRYDRISIRNRSGEMFRAPFKY